MKGTIILNAHEQRLNDIIVKFINKDLDINQVCRLTGLSQRQIYRKQKAYKEKGIASIPHGLKLIPSKKGYSNSLKKKIITLYNEEYFGWNFHHFNDALEDYHDIKVSDSFIYNLFTDNNIESPYKYKNKRKSHPPRPRRENAGELIQVDASKHQWLYNDNTFYYLHGGIDDATGIVTSCFLSTQETIFGYQMIMKDTIMNYGIPECLYTDYRTIFKSNKKDFTLDEELAGKELKNTKFANMLNHIGTDIISTIDPRSKGRIERLWRTFQDRLLKEFIKYKIDSLEKANQYINDVFLPKYNIRFASVIDYTKNSFIKVDDNFNFNTELAVWSEHRIYHNCYLRYDNTYYLIMKDNFKSSIPVNRKVKVFTFLDGTQHIFYNNEWYDLKPIKHSDLEIKPAQENTISISRSEISRKNSQNSPWRKGLPSMRSYRTSNWINFNS